MLLVFKYDFGHMADAGLNKAQSVSSILDHFLDLLGPYSGNTEANVDFQVVHQDVFDGFVLESCYYSKWGLLSWKILGSTENINNNKENKFSQNYSIDTIKTKNCLLRPKSLNNNFWTRPLDFVLKAVTEYKNICIILQSLFIYNEWHLNLHVQLNPVFFIRSLTY